MERQLKHNERHVDKKCGNCGKDFHTTRPWTKHCSYACSYAFMKALQKARRAEMRDKMDWGITCACCRKEGASMTVQLKNKTKGICGQCMKMVQELKYDARYAHRLGYFIRAYFDFKDE